jgi:hypothetical protein
MHAYLLIRNTLLRIFLFLCLLLPFIGNYFSLQQQKKELKLEIKKQLIRNKQITQLTLLKFSKHQLAQVDWEEPGEFEYKGKMYDVVETREERDTVYYWCFQDKDETILNGKLLNFMGDDLANGQDKDEERAKQIMSFCKKLYLHQSTFRRILSSSEKMYCTYRTPCAPPFQSIPPFLPPEIS